MIPVPHIGITPTTIITTTTHTSHRVTECSSGIIIPHIIHLAGVSTMIHSGMTAIMYGIPGTIHDIHLMCISAGRHGDIGIIVTPDGMAVTICTPGVRGAIHDITRYTRSEKELHEHSVPHAAMYGIHVIPAALMYGYRQQEELLTGEPV